MKKREKKEDFVLETENLSFSYSKGENLKGISMRIPRGKKTLILGPNGAGKSTLFLCFNGVNRPSRGKVIFNGNPIKYSKEALEKLRENVVLVFQNPDDQIFSATVEEDVAFGPLNLGLPREEVERRVTEALKAVGIEDLRERPTQQLSFGQRKRVSLAGAIAMNPQVLIMDEPTAGLDTEMVHELLELSDELNNRGITVVMSTHDIETAYEWADEVRAIRKGELVFSGTPEEFFQKEELLHGLGLVPPMAFFLNTQASWRKGIPKRPHPKSVMELLEKLVPARKQRKFGRIKLVLVDKPSSEENKSGKKFPHENTGVYGALARSMAEDGKIDAHYRFHALENAILRASLGKSFLLYSESGLVPLILQKLKRLEIASGRKIELEL